MQLYRQYIFPKFLDVVLSSPSISALRSLALGGAKGEILELGFGTGLNLEHYPDTVTKITVIDPNPGMNQRALRRIAKSPIKVDSIELSAESMPFADNSFDTVVSTWTLCSIPNQDLALREVARVLRPHGRFLFLEHGLSRDFHIQKWQNRLSPLNQMLTDGCHINRDIKESISNALDIETCKEFHFEGYPRTHGHFYIGTARKILH